MTKEKGNEDCSKISTVLRLAQRYKVSNMVVMTVFLSFFGQDIERVVVDFGGCNQV